MRPQGDEAWDEIVRMIRLYAMRKYQGTATGITIHLPGADHREPFPVGQWGGGSTPRWDSGSAPKHLSDFRKVYWPDVGTFILTESQARVVAALWRAWQSGVPEVGQEKLLRAASSDGTRLSDLFKRSTAWGTLVRQGDVPGTYRLPVLEEDGGGGLTHEDDVA